MRGKLSPVDRFFFLVNNLVKILESATYWAHDTQHPHFVSAVSASEVVDSKEKRLSLIHRLPFVDTLSHYQTLVVSLYKLFDIFKGC